MKDHGLGLFFLALLMFALVGQAVAGHAKYNEEERAHAALLEEEPHPISLGRYVTSSEFGQAVMENWQSEYLQFALFILATIWLVQRGSPESKELHKPVGSPRRASSWGRTRNATRRGWRGSAG